MKKKKPYRHVTILEESYNADRQAQDAYFFKSSVKEGAKKIGCGCLLVFLALPVFCLLASILICFS